MAGALHLRYALACAFECILPIKVINSFQSIVLIFDIFPICRSEYGYSFHKYTEVRMFLTIIPVVL